MNIAFVNATIRWGGVKTWSLDFAECLAGRGHAVRIYGRQQAFVDAAKRRVGHGEQAEFGADLNPFAIRRFMREFRAHAIDAVIINIGKDLATAGVAAKLLGIPVVQQIGLPDDIPHRLKTEVLHRWINPHFLSSCQFIETGFLRSLPYLNKQRSHVVLTAKKAVDHPVEIHSPRRILATQQLNADKGHEPLLRALAGVSRPFELHIAGTGSIEGHLKELVKSLGIDHCVHWHGFVDDVPALLRSGDIFLLGSYSEGLPNTLQEALAEGLLPVIRDVGGVREVISPPLEPWVLPYGADEHAFRAALEKALALGDEELMALREEARMTRSRYFDLESKATELEDWLANVVVPEKREKHASC